MSKISFLFFLGLLSFGLFAEYPKHWWGPINDPKAPSWEILPQEAAAHELILSKRNELGILSNFADTSFVFKSKKYATLEGFWQAMKFPEGPQDERLKEGILWPIERASVEQMNGFQAKDAGKIGSENMKILNINWVSFEGKKLVYKTTEKLEHYDLIYSAMVEKLKQNPEVKKILLQTGNLILKPDHVQVEPVSPAWKYHEIWMEIRTRLQKGEIL
jgi:predicted NAD-dependent protein-ADP-ribosyltransferase YbiA (DUF1768 family)